MEDICRCQGDCKGQWKSVEGIWKSLGKRGHSTDSTLTCFPCLLAAQLSLVLERVDKWQFDSFALERASNGRPLSVLAFALFQRTGVTQRFRINETKLARYRGQAAGPAIDFKQQA